MKLLLVLFLGAVFAANTCVYDIDGKHFDLSGLILTDPSRPYDAQYAVGSSTWDFYFAICDNLDSTFTDQYDDCTTSSQLPAAAIQIDQYGQCKRVGVFEPRHHFSTLTQEDHILNITYGGGAYCFGAQHDRQIHFLITCAQTAKPPTINEVPPQSCFYNVYWDHPAGCPISGSAGGISAGTVLLIITLVLMTCYFAGGILFQKLKRGATGKEIIPCAGFWFGLPGLVWDGMKFLFNLMTCCCNKGASYAPLR